MMIGELHSLQNANLFNFILNFFVLKKGIDVKNAIQYELLVNGVLASVCY